MQCLMSSVSMRGTTYNLGEGFIFREETRWWNIIPLVDDGFVGSNI